MTAVAILIGAVGVALVWGAVTGKNPLAEVGAALHGTGPRPVPPPKPLPSPTMAPVPIFST